MEKVLVVAFRPGDAPTLDPTEILRLDERLLRDLDATRYPGVSLQVSDDEATAQWRRGGRPGARQVAAVLALWTESGDDVGAVTRIVGDVWPDHAVSVVTETVPRWRTDRATSAVEPQPGVIVTSLLHRAPAMTRDEFVGHWRDVHQPMSLRIHPQHTYVRNVVARVLVPASPQFDAVCEEGFASVDDVLDRSRFFGADVATATWQENATTIGDDIPRFLDTGRTVAIIMREHRLRDFRRP